MTSPVFIFNLFMFFLLLSINLIINLNNNTAQLLVMQKLINDKKYSGGKIATPSTLFSLTTNMADQEVGHEFLNQTFFR